MLFNGLNLSLNLGSPSSGTSLTTQLLEHIQVTLRGSGYSDQATNEITAAMSTLAQYGILGMGLGLTAGSGNSGGTGHLVPSGTFLGISPMDSTPSQTTNGVGNSGGVFGPIGTVSGLGNSSPTPRGGIDRFGDGSSGGGNYDPFRRQASPSSLGSPISLNNNSFGLGTGQQQSSISSLCKSPTPGDLKGDQKKLELEISENIIGAILGPGGRALVEIQHLSGASIQISKKGMFAPGTRNRIVYISGCPNAITNAQYLIEQRVGEEEAKRSSQSSIGGILQ